jgi:hypothetical protein
MHSDETVAKWGMPTRHIIDLSGSTVVKGEVQKITMTYDQRISRPLIFRDALRDCRRHCCLLAVAPKRQNPEPPWRTCERPSFRPGQDALQVADAMIANPALKPMTE